MDSPKPDCRPVLQCSCWTMSEAPANRITNLSRMSSKCWPFCCTVVCPCALAGWCQSSLMLTGWPAGASSRAWIPCSNPRTGSRVLWIHRCWCCPAGPRHSKWCSSCCGLDSVLVWGYSCLQALRKAATTVALQVAYRQPVDSSDCWGCICIQGTSCAFSVNAVVNRLST